MYGTGGEEKSLQYAKCALGRAGCFGAGVTVALHPVCKYPPFHTDNTPADNFNVDDITVCSSAALLRSSRRVAAAAAVAAILDVAAAAKAEAVAASAPAAPASAENGLAVLPWPPRPPP